MAAKKTIAKVSPKPEPAVKGVKAVKKVKPKPSGSGATSGEALAEGSPAPSFSLPDENGKLVNSASLAGKPYVLYFYPKDDTPGCTQEACDFRDSSSLFAGKKVRVIGVSPDDSKRHAKFKEKYGLTFSLLSDPEKTLIEAYGVWVKKQNYGREYMGVQRSTFIVDKHGKIAKAWRGVRVPGHVVAVLAAL